MELWQIPIAVFLFLLPIVLMRDFWGDERLTFRGKPIIRRWKAQITHPDPHEAHH